MLWAQSRKSIMRHHNEGAKLELHSPKAKSRIGSLRREALDGCRLAQLGRCAAGRGSVGRTYFFLTASMSPDSDSLVPSNNHSLPSAHKIPGGWALQ